MLPRLLSLALGRGKQGISTPRRQRRCCRLQGWCLLMAVGPRRCQHVRPRGSLRCTLPHPSTGALLRHTARVSCRHQTRKMSNQPLLVSVTTGNSAVRALPATTAGAHHQWWQLAQQHVLHPDALWQARRLWAQHPAGRKGPGWYPSSIQLIASA